jgi:hypothetical protein
MAIDFATAISRLLAGYWNSGSKTEANPGGFGNDGHTENLPELAEALGVVGSEVATKATAANGDASDASDAADAAGLSAIAAANAASAASTARNKAEQWADADEDTEVEAGTYSAKHHAAKAAQSAVDAAAAVNGVRVSANDDTPKHLEQALLPGAGIEMSTQNEGGNETRTVSVNLGLIAGIAYALS